jgi:P-type conjugative transfer protein TrbJ
MRSKSKLANYSLSALLAASLSVGPVLPAHAILGVGDIVHDPTAFAQLIKQVENTLQMIGRLKQIYGEIDKLRKYADLDHDSLADKGKFIPFLLEYKSLFKKIQEQIESYHEGGLMGQLSRLDQVYASYYDDWGMNEDEDKNDAKFLPRDPNHNALAKQILWTRVQFKHAAKVGAKIRDSIPDTQKQIETLLQDTNESQGLLLAIQIGNQLTGMVAKSVQTLNTAVTEQIQAQVGQGLEQNQKQGLKMKRIREAVENWGEVKDAKVIAPKNPFQNY